LFREILFSVRESISDSFFGEFPPPGTESECTAFPLPVTTLCSTIVFHSPHAGQRPIHLEYSLPQFEQNQIVFSLFAILQMYAKKLQYPGISRILQKNKPQHKGLKY
jgi:hypothetical protein